jgi:hypothetical protein
MRLVNELWNHEQGVIFQKPVDPILLRLYDYYDIIKEPMDLSTVKCKLITNRYQGSSEFLREVLLIFHNCIRYNGTLNEVGRAALQLKQRFREGVLKCEVKGAMGPELARLEEDWRRELAAVQVKVEVKKEEEEQPTPMFKAQDSPLRPHLQASPKSLPMGSPRLSPKKCPQLEQEAN